MRGFPYLLILTAALLLVLLSPIKLRALAKQTGLSVRLTLQIHLLFGLIRLPFGFVLKIDAEKAEQNPLEVKKAFSFFKLTKNGELIPIKRKNPKKPKHERLPIAPLLGAFSLEKLAVKGTVALEDAAACAFLSGALNCAVKPILTLAAELSPIDARKAAIAVEFLPKFSEASVCMALEGILETNSAKLIKGGFSALSKRNAKKRTEIGRIERTFGKRPQKTYG